MSDTPKQQQVTREALSDYAHEAWSGWMRYLFSKSETTESGEVLIPTWAVERWKRQATTAYADLPESEKTSDRAESDKILAITNAYATRIEGERDALEEQVRGLKQSRDSLMDIQKACHEDETTRLRAELRGMERRSIRYLLQALDSDDLVIKATVDEECQEKLLRQNKTRYTDAMARLAELREGGEE